MSWVSAAAVFFVVWWLVLFAMLPFSLKTQDEEGEVTLGTTASAPRGPHVLRAMVRTTVVTVLVCGVFFGLTRGLGLDVNDLPRIVPTFED